MHWRIAAVFLLMLIMLSCSTSNKQEDRVDLLSQSPTGKQLPNWEQKSYFSSDSLMRIELTNNWKVQWKSYHRSEGYSFELTFDSRDLFSKQIRKMAKLLDEIGKEIDIAELNRLNLSFISNVDLALELASIPEIAKNIAENSSKGHRWVSMKVVEENIHQSKLISDCLSKFEKFDLGLDGFVVDKCSYHIHSQDEEMRMYCANIVINFTKSK